MKESQNHQKASQGVWITSISSRWRHTVTVMQDIIRPFKLKLQPAVSTLLCQRRTYLPFCLSTLWYVNHPQLACLPLCSSLGQVSSKKEERKWQWISLIWITTETISLKWSKYVLPFITYPWIWYWLCNSYASKEVIKVITFYAAYISSTCAVKYFVCFYECEFSTKLGHYALQNDRNWSLLK